MPNATKKSTENPTQHLKPWGYFNQTTTQEQAYVPGISSNSQEIKKESWSPIWGAGGLYKCGCERCNASQAQALLAKPTPLLC